MQHMQCILGTRAVMALAYLDRVEELERRSVACCENTSYRYGTSAMKIVLRHYHKLRVSLFLFVVTYVNY